MFAGRRAGKVYVREGSAEAADPRTEGGPDYKLAKNKKGRARAKNGRRDGPYKGEFTETCLAVYDALNIERRNSQRDLLKIMAQEAEATYAAKREASSAAEAGAELGDGTAGAGVFVGQAPVGTGKTYVMLILAFTSFWLYGKKTVLSTQTKVLQNQILKKDFPVLKKMLADSAAAGGLVDAEALGLWTAHLVKGRNNYLCPRKVSEYMAATAAGRDMVVRAPGEKPVRISYHQLLALNGGRDGVRMESLDLDRYSRTGNWNEEVLSLISTSARNCEADGCAYFPRRCPYYNAKYMDSPLIICNHETVKSILRPPEVPQPEDAESAGPEGAEEETAGAPEKGTQLPLEQADNYIFDEAHHFMGYFCGRRVLFGVQTVEVKNALAAPVFCSRDEESRPEVTKAAELREETWRLWKSLCAESAGAAPKRAEKTAAGAAASAAALAEALESIPEEAACEAARKAAELAGRLGELKERLGAPRPGEELHISGDGVEFAGYSPGGLDTDINAKLKQASFAAFISGTLFINGSPSVFEAEAGLPESSRSAAVPSPFSHSNILLWVPRASDETVVPNLGVDRAETERLHRQFIVNFCAQRIPEYVKMNLGGVLVLCSSRKTQEAVAGALRPRVEAIPGRAFFVQGDMPRARLVANFLNCTSPVLIGLNSFREGFDAAMGKLTWVIIDKLPFGYKEDPELNMRLKILKEKKGLDEGKHLINLMTFDLIQAMGRLERTASDWGALTVLDPRFYWLCSFGAGSPDEAFDPDFLAGASAALARGEGRYGWMSLKKFAKATGRTGGTGSGGWLRPEHPIDGLIPFDWNNPKNFKRGMPGLDEWIRTAKRLRVEAEYSRIRRAGAAPADV